MNLDQETKFEHTIQSILNTCLFLMFVLRSMPNHTPFKYKYPFKMSKQLGSLYLTYHENNLPHFCDGVGVYNELFKFGKCMALHRYSCLAMRARLCLLLWYSLSIVLKSGGETVSLPVHLGWPCVSLLWHPPTLKLQLRSCEWC